MLRLKVNIMTHDDASANEDHAVQTALEVIEKIKNSIKSSSGNHEASVYDENGVNIGSWEVECCDSPF